MLQVLDRLQLSVMLDQLQHMQLPNGVHARAPRYLQLDSFTVADVRERLHTAGERSDIWDTQRIAAVSDVCVTRKPV